MRAVLQEYQPDVVGISSKTQNFGSACTVAQIAKQLNPRAIVVVGGPHPSMVGTACLKCENIDVAVMGEGERTIVDLLAAISSGSDFRSIHGIAYREHGRVVQTPPREFISDLDSLPFPHASAPRTLHKYEQYPPQAFRNLFAIRGCPYNCFFCGSRNVWSRKVRFRSPENVVAEIKALGEKGIRYFDFRDDTFGVNKKYLLGLCGLLAEQCRGIHWVCEMPVLLIDDEVLRAMKLGGCDTVKIGIESGSNQILRDMRKSYTIDEACQACRTVKRHGLTLHTFFMVGFPQETEATLGETLAAMKRISPDGIVYSIFTPYPGTEAFEYCREHGLVNDSFDPSLYNHTSPENSFTLHLSHQKLRELLVGVERQVERINTANKFRRLFTLAGLRRLREKGLIPAFREGLRALRRM